MKLIILTFQVVGGRNGTEKFKKTITRALALGQGGGGVNPKFFTSLFTGCKLKINILFSHLSLSLSFSLSYMTLPICLSLQSCTPQTLSPFLFPNCRNATILLSLLLCCQSLSMVAAWWWCGCGIGGVRVVD